MHQGARALLIGIMLCLGFAGRAEAHKPLQIGGVASGHTRETAQVIREPEVSWVLYLELRQPEQVDTFRFTAHAGAVIPIQLGVPETSEFKRFRPVAVLVGPGLATGSVASRMDLRPGEGSVTLRFEDDPPRTFYEPFTRTRSWVTGAYRTPLPQDGEYHVAVYEPHGVLGKYFLAIGEREAFTPADWLSLPQVIRQVRSFYGL